MKILFRIGSIHCSEKLLYIAIFHLNLLFILVSSLFSILFLTQKMDLAIRPTQHSIETRSGVQTNNRHLLNIHALYRMATICTSEYKYIRRMYHFFESNFCSFNASYFVSEEDREARYILHSEIDMLIESF